MERWRTKQLHLMALILDGETFRTHGNFMKLGKWFDREATYPGEDCREITIIFLDGTYSLL